MYSLCTQMSFNAVVLGHSKDESKQIYHWVIVIPVLLGSPGKWHPVLAQALACLLGSFEHLLSSLWRHGRRQRPRSKSIQKKRGGKKEEKITAAFVMCMCLNEVKSKDGGPC